MLLKRIKVWLLVVIAGTCIGITVPVAAEVGDESVLEEILLENDFEMIDEFEVMPTELATASAVSKISKTSSGVKATGVFVGVSSLKSVVVKLSLQKYSSSSWKTIKTWTGSTSKKSFTISKSQNVGNGKYRSKCIFTVKTNTKSDSFTKYSSAINK
ncbi:MAG: hypothetical protein PHD56_12860 [Anaerostipes sp.]|jgi:hypothetical protein|nr:hypothetical protein [Anaerostipes sp.]